jgi:hypothetical protein
VSDRRSEEFAVSSDEAVRAIEIFFEGFNAESDARTREALNFTISEPS